MICAEIINLFCSMPDLLDNSPFALRFAPHVGTVLVAATENETAVSRYDATIQTLQTCGVSSIGPLIIKGDDNHPLLWLCQKISSNLTE